MAILPLLVVICLHLLDRLSTRGPPPASRSLLGAFQHPNDVSIPLLRHRLLTHVSPLDHLIIVYVTIQLFCLSGPGLPDCAP
jgi:hypothetical protein